MNMILQRIRSPHWWRWGVLPLSYTLLCIPFFWQTFATWGSDLATRCQMRCDSGWENVWSLWWVAHQLSIGESPFYTAQMFYPGGADLFWQILMFANGLLMTPVTLIWGPVFAFNLLAMVSFVASAWAMALCAEQIVGHRWAAWIAGVLYTFAPFHVWMAYWGFAERLSLQYFPIMLYALWELSGQQRWRGVWIGAFAILGALLSSLYYGLFALTYVVIWAGLMTWRDRGERVRLTRFWMQLVSMAAMVAVPIAPFAWHMLVPGKQLPTVGDGVGLTDYLIRQKEFSASLFTFVTPGITHPLWGDAVLAWYRQFSPSYWPMSLGLSVVVLAVLGIYLVRHQIASWWLTMTAVLVVLALGPRLMWFGYDTGIPLPYDILNYIPLVKLGQRPNHFLLLALAQLALFAAYAIRSGAQRLRRPYLWGVLLLGVIGFELWPLPLQPFAPTPSVVYDAIPRQQRGAVLPLPFDLDDGNVLYGQWYYQRPIVTGYLPRLNPELVNTGLLQGADGVVQFTQPITTMTVLHQDPATALTTMMDRLDIEYVLYDKRFGTPVNLAVLEKLQFVVGDANLALYRRPPQSATGALVVLNRGWFPPEQDDAGRRWQWSAPTGAFWLYQPQNPPHAAIITARFSVPAAMQIGLDGGAFRNPIRFVVNQPQMVRRYQLLVFSTGLANDLWWQIYTPFQAADRDIGIALEDLRAELTTLVMK